MSKYVNTLSNVIMNDPYTPGTWSSKVLAIIKSTGALCNIAMFL